MFYSTMDSARLSSFHFDFICDSGDTEVQTVRKVGPFEPALKLQIYESVDNKRPLEKTEVFITINSICPLFGFVYISVIWKS
jgi:hypothetical protein